MVGAVRFDSMEVFKEELVFSNLNLYVIENLWRVISRWGLKDTLISTKKMKMKNSGDHSAVINDYMINLTLIIAISTQNLEYILNNKICASS